MDIILAILSSLFQVVLDALPGFIREAVKSTETVEISNGQVQNTSTDGDLSDTDLDRLLW
jgi:hypothetical protein